MGEHRGLWKEGKAIKWEEFFSLSFDPLKKKCFSKRGYRLGQTRALTLTLGTVQKLLSRIFHTNLKLGCIEVHLIAVHVQAEESPRRFISAFTFHDALMAGSRYCWESA